MGVSMIAVRQLSSGVQPQELSLDDLIARIGV
jgi:hypothetical protein